eukprot:scaffold1163_cov362-Prasinococcus_capsulatus_cf.AAC.1
MDAGSPTCRLSGNLIVVLVEVAVPIIICCRTKCGPRVRPVAFVFVATAFGAVALANSDVVAVVVAVAMAIAQLHVVGLGDLQVQLAARRLEGQVAAGAVRGHGRRGNEAFLAPVLVDGPQHRALRAWTDLPPCLKLIRQRGLGEPSPQRCHP